METPSEKIFECDTLIIGAGMAGLAASSRIQKANRTVIVLEKSRGLGGRCSTKRGSGSQTLADTGAQFFSQTLDYWSELESASDLKLKEVMIDGSTHPRFVHPQGMSKLARFFETAAAVQTSKRVAQIKFLPELARYEISCETGEHYRATHVILTAPLPQSLELIHASSPDLAHLKIEPALAAIEYDRCITLVLELEKAIDLPPMGIWKFPHPQLDGIFNQVQKGLESPEPVLVVQASPHFSDVHWDEDLSELEVRLEAETRSYLRERGISLAVKSKLIHKWKYSMPRSYSPSRFASLSENKNRFLLAGDAFVHSSVEGAISSGLAAAEFILGDA